MKYLMILSLAFTACDGPLSSTTLTTVPGNTYVKGTPGDKGSDGLQGASGATGVSGLNGSNGVKGSTGEKGAKGDTGPTGAGTTGVAGAKGSTGNTGAMGYTGPAGPKGDAGTSGARCSFRVSYTLTERVCHKVSSHHYALLNDGIITLHSTSSCYTERETVTIHPTRRIAHCRGITYIQDELNDSVLDVIDYN